MSRTDLDATTLANSLRMRAGDGSIEWVYEPIQASVLLDIADMLDENAKLRELVRELLPCYQWSDCYDGCMAADGPLCPNPAKLTERARELGVEVDG